MKQFGSHNYHQSLHHISKKSVYSAMIFAAVKVYLIKYLSYNKVVQFEGI